MRVRRKTMKTMKTMKLFELPLAPPDLGEE